MIRSDILLGVEYPKLISKISKSVAFIQTKVKVAGGEMAGEGTGFVIEGNNTLVTCNHVVREPNLTINLKFPDDKDWRTAEVVVRDEEHDLALLKFDGDSRPALPLLDDKVVEGMQVIFSGYPLSINSLTTHLGIISAIAKDQTNKVTYLIDGTVNPGNSGCPLLSLDGKVIGVVNATNRQDALLLGEVNKMLAGAVSLYGKDLTDIFRALINNLQLGIGYAIPSYYIPKRIDAPPKAKIKKGKK